MQATETCWCCMIFYASSPRIVVELLKDLEQILPASSQRQIADVGNSHPAPRNKKHLFTRMMSTAATRMAGPRANALVRLRRMTGMPSAPPPRSWAQASTKSKTTQDAVQVYVGASDAFFCAPRVTGSSRCPVHPAAHAPTHSSLSKHVRL